MMKTKIEESWCTLVVQANNQLVDTGGLRLLRVSPSLNKDFYAGVESSGAVVLAIGVKKCPPSCGVEGSAFQYFRQQRLDGSWLIVLRLLQPTLIGVFGILCQDLADAAEDVDSDIALVSLVHTRLNLWQKLFKGNANGFLLPHEVKGLIGELLELERLALNEQLDAVDVVEAWVGPLGADQDFRFLTQRVEVKALGSTAQTVTISSLEQLNCPETLSLDLFILATAEIGDPTAFTLNGLVARVESILAKSPIALIQFRERLLEARYIEHEHYNSPFFRLVGYESYPVGDYFPRLEPGCIPIGITAVRYDISLAALRGL